MNTQNICVLYVDDEIDNLNAFKANFRRDLTVFTANSADEGLQVLENNKIHVVLSDHMMPNTSGVEFLEQLVIEYPDIYRILLTGCSDINVVIDAINRGKVYRFLSKPWEKEELMGTIVGAYELFKKKEESSSFNQRLIETNQQLEFMLRQKLTS